MASEITESLLLKFCRHDEKEPNNSVGRPFVHEGRTYASDGRALVVVHHPVPLSAPGHAQFPVKTCKEIIIPQAECKGEMIDVQLLTTPPRETCSACKGLGKGSWITCPCCRGDRYVTPVCPHCGISMAYQCECHECQGEGRIPSPNGKEEPCEFCNGAGTTVDTHFKVACGNYFIGGPMLELLRLLPDCRVPTVGDYLKVQRGEFTGGDVYFMPLRPEGNLK